MQGMFCKVTHLKAPFRRDGFQGHPRHLQPVMQDVPEVAGRAVACPVRHHVHPAVLQLDLLLDWVQRGATPRLCSLEHAGTPADVSFSGFSSIAVLLHVRRASLCIPC